MTFSKGLKKTMQELGINQRQMVGMRGGNRNAKGNIEQGNREAGQKIQLYSRNAGWRDASAVPDNERSKREERDTRADCSSTAQAPGGHPFRRFVSLGRYSGSFHFVWVQADTGLEKEIARLALDIQEGITALSRNGQNGRPCKMATCTLMMASQI